MRYMATYGDHPTPAETQAAIKLELIDRKRRVTVAYQEWKDEVQERKRLHDNAQQLMQEESKARRARTTAAGQKPFAPEYSPQPFRDAPIPAWIEEEAKRMGVTLNFRAGARSVFARSSASTKALRTIYNYLEVVRTEWGEDRGIEAGRELQKAAKAIAADPSSQDIAAEIAQLVRVATTDKSYDKRDRALDDLESIINQAQSQHARRKGKTSMAQAGFTVPPEVKERTLAKNKADALKLINDNIRYLENLSQHPPDQYAGQVNNLANIALEAGEGHIADSNWKGYLSNQESHVLVEKINRAFEKLNEHGFHVTMHSRSGSKMFSIEQPAYDDSWRTSKKTPLVDGYTAKERKAAMDAYRFAVSQEDRYLGSVFVTPSGQRKYEEETRAAYLKAKKLNPNYQGFSRSGSRSRMGSGDPYMEDKDVKIHKGDRSDIVAYVSQNGGGGDFIAGLARRDHTTKYNHVIWSKMGYATPAAAERSAIKKFDAYVANIKYSRVGAKAAFARSLVASQGNKRIYLDGPDGNDNFNIYLVQLVNTGIPNESPHEDLLRMKSYSTEARARVAAKKMLSSRNGVKARFGQPNTVAVRKTLQGNFEVIYWKANGKEESYSLYANEEMAKEKAKDLARQLGMQFFAGRSRFGIAERVLNDGSVHLDFKVFRESLSGKSDSSLNFIMRDAADARDAMGPDGKKFNYYADIVNEVGDEIARRKNGKSRSNRSGDRKQSFEAGDSFMVEGYVGDAITGGRSARTMEEAEHYANAMLAMIKRNAGGKPVKVEIQEIKAYNPQGVIKTMHSRGESEISTRFGSIASKLGFLPDSITESNGVATLKFAQADGSAGRCAFAMIRPLTGIVGSDRVTATDTEVRVQFARGSKTTFGSDVILEDIGDDQVRVTARVEGRSAGSFDGPKSQSAQLLLKALKIAGQGHEVSSGVYDMTHITLNDAAKRAMPKSAMMSRGGKAEFAMGVGDTVKVKQGGKTVSGKIIKLPNATDLENGQYLIELPNQLYNDGRVTRELVPANRILMSRARFGHANQQIADGVARLLSVLGFAAMAEEAKTATDADTLKRYINVARRRIKGSDQADRFNTLADKLERMLMSRGR